MTTCRADLHVHSRHSNRPDEWLLRRIAAPESFTEPLEVYRRCRARGMDFVTVSDHDTIDGALEIAHLPGTFLSCEVTARFPEDDCKIHCLVLGVTEAQHREIQRLRHDVYDLRYYLHDEGILHSVAHPFYRVNDRLTLEHVEKLLVLFKRFEARNGMHDRRLNRLAEAVLGGLTPEMTTELGRRHRLDPCDERPWEKLLTGGSDDHGGLYLATTWTETPPAATVDEYLGHLRRGASAPGGESGSALRLAHSLFAISHTYFQERFAGALLARNDPFARMLRRLGRPEAEAPRRWWRPRRARPDGSPPAAAPGERTLEHANRACAQLVERFARDVALKLRLGRIGDALGALSQLTPLAAVATSYAVAFRTQAKDEALLVEVRERLAPGTWPPTGERSDARAWITDSLGEGGGVAPALRALAGAAERRGRELAILTCGDPARSPRPPAGLHYLAPLSSFPLPGHEELTLSVPPFLELLDHCERRRISELVIATPGPMGLAGLAAGRLLGLRVSGVYQTDLARRVGQLTDDPVLEEATWAYVRWFFGRMDRLLVSSQELLEGLAVRGFDRRRLVHAPDDLLDHLWDRPEEEDGWRCEPSRAASSAAA